MSFANNNTTTNISAAPYDYSIPFIHPVYIIQGCLMFVANALIVGAVMKYKALYERKVGLIYF
jgi:hypothetical protein